MYNVLKIREKKTSPTSQKEKPVRFPARQILIVEVEKKMMDYPNNAEAPGAFPSRNL
jgi:hypothetical protein